MAQLVKMGATLTCSFGAAPASLIVEPVNRTNAEGGAGGKHHGLQADREHPAVRYVQAPTNPEVIAAMAAAAGVLTPQPCVPVIPAPWTPGSPTVTIGGMPALDNTSKCMCTWAGVITITMPATVKTNVA